MQRQWKLVGLSVCAALLTAGGVRAESEWKGTFTETLQNHIAGKGADFTITEAAECTVGEGKLKCKASHTEVVVQEVVKGTNAYAGENWAFLVVETKEGKGVLTVGSLKLKGTCTMESPVKDSHPCEFEMGRWSVHSPKAPGATEFAGEATEEGRTVKWKLTR
jgi:hypothetical protein